MHRLMSFHQRGTSARAEILCRVCGDKASGRHYGVPSCDGCRGFFKRSIRRNLEYVCKEGGSCVVDVTRRNQCQSCRFKKCLAVNMKREAVQHERAPRVLAMRRGAPQFFCPPSHLPPGPSIVPPTYHLRPELPFPWFQWNPFAPITRLSLSISEALKRDENSEILTSQRKQQLENDSETEIDVGEEVLQVDEPLQSLTPDCDPACNLLNLAMKWTKTIPSFNQMSRLDRQRLLEVTWPELFAIHAAQWGFIFTKGLRLAVLLQAKFPLPPEQSLIENPFPEMTADPEFLTLRHIVQKIHDLQLDHTEYVCLKALVLFRSDVIRLDDQPTVDFLQNQTQGMLFDHCLGRQGFQSNLGVAGRFTKILLLLPSLRALNKTSLNSLFPSLAKTADSLLRSII